MRAIISVIHLFFIGFVFISGCRIGASLNNVHVANYPSGDRILITLKEKSTNLNGELLSIHDESVIMLTWELEIVEVFYSKANRMMIGRNKILLSGELHPGQKKRSEFRIYGRFPQGISEELMASLLSSYNQEEVKVLK